MKKQIIPDARRAASSASGNGASIRAKHYFGTWGAVAAALCFCMIIAAVLIASGAKADHAELTFPLVYSDDEISVTVNKAEPLEQPVIYEASWLSTDEIDLEAACDLVVLAKVINIDEIKIDSTKEITRTDYASLLTLEIEKTYYGAPSAGFVPPCITAASEVSSRFMPSDAALYEEGREYYLFLQKASNSKSPLGYERFCDYTVRLPKTEDYVICSGAPMTSMLATLLMRNVDNEELKGLLFEGADMDDALSAVIGEEGENQ